MRSPPICGIWKKGPDPLAHGVLRPLQRPAPRRPGHRPTWQTAPGNILYNAVRSNQSYILKCSELQPISMTVSIFYVPETGLTLPPQIVGQSFMDLFCSAVYHTEPDPNRRYMTAKRQERRGEVGLGQALYNANISKFPLRIETSFISKCFICFDPTEIEHYVFGN